VRGDALSAKGARGLAVASRDLPPPAGYPAADEQALTLVGFVTFADPPTPDAAEALAALHRDGVAVKILTGDNELVARPICVQVGLDSGQVVLGDQLDAMTDAALGAVAERATLFARVSRPRSTGSSSR
jgi:Mg2+-importing ATPase